MHNMKEQMESFQAQQQGRAQATQPKEEKKPEATGEYIDFEEVTSK
jgi:hypothetical protein